MKLFNAITAAAFIGLVGMIAFEQPANAGQIFPQLGDDCPGGSVPDNGGYCRALNGNQFFPLGRDNHCPQRFSPVIYAGYCRSLWGA